MIDDVIRDVWPHDTFREHQLDVTRDAIQRLVADDKDYYVLSAPTGFGKSPVALTVAAIVGELMHEPHLEYRRRLEQWDGLGRERGYLVSPQNILLDQLASDYSSEDSFGMVKGRNNYQCYHAEEDGTDCTDGPCRFWDASQCNYESCEDGNCDNVTHKCVGYRSARDRALSSAITATNFTYLMVSPKTDQRGALVVDEAHNAPQEVLRQVEIKIRSEELFGVEVPASNSFSGWIEWVREAKPVVENELKAIKEIVNEQARNGDPDEMDVRRRDTLERLDTKLAILLSDYENTGEEWVVETSGGGLDGETAEEVSFRPVTPYRFMENRLWGKGKKVFISSATPPPPDLMGLDGLDGVVREVESEFDTDNRPVVYKPVGKLTASERNENLEGVINALEHLAEGKTIFHAKTYDYATTVGNQLSARVGSENVIVQSRGGREVDLERWKDGDVKYYISVSMTDGIDLKGDICRTNIIGPLEFPYWGDEQIQARIKKEDKRFYNWQVIRDVQQAYGRSTRSRDDHSVTYILDGSFAKLYVENKSLFEDWFREALYGV